MEIGILKEKKLQEWQQICDHISHSVKDGNI